MSKTIENLLRVNGSERESTGVHGSELGGDGRRSNSRFADRRGENQRFYVKTRVPEPFCSFRRSFLCTGAVVSHFVHRRGGFAKLCKTIAPVHENRSSAKSSKTYEKTPSFNRNRRTPRAVWPLFFRVPPPIPPPVPPPSLLLPITYHMTTDRETSSGPAGCAEHLNKQTPQ